MKLTWFGNDTFRIHAAGSIMLVEGEWVPEGVERAELMSGVDIVFRFAEVGTDFAEGWKPRAPLRMLDEAEEVRKPEIVGLGRGMLVLDSDGEAPLVLARDGVTSGGRWMGQAVVVLAGQGLAERGQALLEGAAPRLLALAGSDAEVDAAFAALRDQLDGTGLVALERGLAVEV